MKAIVIHEYGPPEVLRYEQIAEPEPRSGEFEVTEAPVAPEVAPAKEPSTP